MAESNSPSSDQVNSISALKAAQQALVTLSDFAKKDQTRLKFEALRFSMILLPAFSTTHNKDTDGVVKHEVNYAWGINLNQALQQILQSKIGIHDNFLNDFH